MWKMNDIYVAENGGEWPPTHVPASFQQYYIKRHNGDYTAITDGTQATTNAGVYNTCAALWGLVSGPSVDAISFNLSQTGTSAGYRITKIGLGAGAGYWNGAGTSPTWMGKIYSGNGCVTANIIYDTGFVNPGYAQGTDVWGTQFASTTMGTALSSFQFINLPEPATPYGGTATIPTLSFGSWYTIAFAYRVSPTTYSYYPNTAGGWVTGNSITLSNGNVITQNIATTGTFTDSNPYGGSTGTTATDGIHQVMAYEFLV
jgi:hypothetical protein